MANPLAKTLIAIVAACVTSSFAPAQDDDLFKEAVRLLRTNQPEAALEKMQEYLAQNPGDAEAFQLWQEIDSAVWQMLLVQEGEISTIAKHLLTRARAARREASRDEDAINELVGRATAGENYGVREKAALTLAADHGEFAVPALLRVLGDSDADEEQDRALLALQKIGSPAIAPLVEALRSDNDVLRRNIAAGLAYIGDPRAAASLARVASEDANESVRAAARRGLERFGVAPGTSALDLYTRDAHAYLTGIGLQGTSMSEVVWTYGDGGLVAHDVPAAVYHLELAKKAAHEAMRLDPADERARTLLARSYLAEAQTILDSVAANPEDEAMQELVAKVEPLRMVAMTTGTATLRTALRDSLAEGQNHVAVAAIEALGRAESRDSLAQSPLLNSLNNEDTRVGYASALAITKVSGGAADVPQAGRVVEVLGRAVTEEALRLVKVVGGGPKAETAAREAASLRGGTIVDATMSGNDAVVDLFNFPNYDIVVVSESLEDVHPRTLIDVIRRKAPEAKILLAAASEEAAEAYGDRIDGVIVGELSADVLVEKANELVENLEPRRAQANDIAVAASRALESLAGSKVAIDAALGSLAAQLNRDDAVAIPAARALGAGGTAGQLDALVTAITGDGSLELRVAAAGAAGDILGRGNAVPTPTFDALIAVASDDGADVALRSAVVTALGRGSLAPGERQKLAETLGTIAQAGGGEL